MPSIFPWSSPTAEKQSSAGPAEPALEQESLELTCEVDIPAMKEEEEGLQSDEIANEEEEVALNDFEEPTLHCGECNFKVGFILVIYTA